MTTHSLLSSTRTSPRWRFVILCFVNVGLCETLNAFVLHPSTSTSSLSLLLQKKGSVSSFSSHYVNERTIPKISRSQLFGWFEERDIEKSNGPTSTKLNTKNDATPTSTLVSKEEKPTAILDDLECSIDNLDACIKMRTDGVYDEGRDGTASTVMVIEDEIPIDVFMECSIDNLDACMAVSNGGKTGNNKEQAGGATNNFDQSLRQFLSLPIVELQLAFLVFLSSFVVGLGTLQSIPPPVALLSKYGELLISSIFTLEYIARWKLNDFSFKYVVTPLALIDLVAILPTIIKLSTFLGLFVGSTAATSSIMGGALINLRLLRILRLQRVLTDYETFQKFEMALGQDPSNIKPYQLQLARVVISIFTLLSVTSGLIYSAEHVVNPDVPDYFTALYFSLTTLTTVGFGDIHPVTNAGRWIISGSILVGSAVVPAQAAALVEALLDRQEDKNNNNNNKLTTAGTNGNEDGTAQKKINESSSFFPQQQQQQPQQIDNDVIVARMEHLEQKLDDTNARIDRVLAVLESTTSITTTTTKR